MRVWIRTITVLVPALLLLSACDDPHRPGSTTPLGDLDLTWSSGEVGADLMPGPPEERERLRLFAEVVLHNDGASPYSGLELATADLILVEDGKTLGTLILESDWEGDLDPEETVTVNVRCVGQAGDGFDLPCSLEVRLLVAITTASGRAREFVSPELTFYCVH